MSAEVTLPWFHVVWTSVIKEIRASLVEEFDWPLNWLVGIRLSFPARKVRQLATMHSRISARHSRRVISRYALGLE